MEAFAKGLDTAADSSVKRLDEMSLLVRSLSPFKTDDSDGWSVVNTKGGMLSTGGGKGARWVAFQHQESIDKKLRQTFLILQEAGKSVLGYKYTGPAILDAGSIVNHDRIIVIKDAGSKMDDPSVDGVLQSLGDLVKKSTGFHASQHVRDPAEELLRQHQIQLDMNSAEAELIRKLRAF